MRKKQTPKERLITRLKSEGIIPLDHEIVIDVPRYSTRRREMQWLPRVVILHRPPNCPVFEEIFAGTQTVTELSQARHLVLHEGTEGRTARPNGPKQLTRLVVARSSEVRLQNRR